MYFQPTFLLLKQEGLWRTNLLLSLFRVRITLRLTVSQYVMSIRLCVGSSSVAHNQICITVGDLRSSCCGRPLWREDRSAIYSYTYNSLSLSGSSSAELITSYCLIWDSPQPGGPGPRIYNPQEQGGTVIPPGIGFPLLRLLRLAELFWRYSNPPPHGSRSFIWNGKRVKRLVQQFLCCLAFFVAAVTFFFNDVVPRNGNRIFTEPLPSNDEGHIYGDTDWWVGFMDIPVIWSLLP
jgi:hypothetical protein